MISHREEPETDRGARAPRPVYLAYGTRRPKEVVFYSRRNALLVNGAGVMVPVEHVPSLEQ